MRKVFTNTEHAAWLREQARLKRPYWYGCYFNPCTEALLAKKKAQYPEHYGEGRMPRYRQDIAEKQIAGDCVNGAIKGAVWSELGRRAPVYASNGCPDTNADGMFAKCKAWGMEWGPIGTLPDEPGIGLHMAGHVGVTVGNGEAVEWRGFDYGCVTTKIRARRWLHWFRLPWTEYVTGGMGGQTAEVNLLGARLLMRGCMGSDVRTMQELLMKLGFQLPVHGADGDFGSETEAAVKAFQKKLQLKADGKYGEQTHAALTGALAEEETEEEKTDAAAEKQVVITGGCVRIRSGAGQEYDTIGFVREGTRLDWLATAGNGWHAVRTDGVNGWVGPRYTRVEEGSA